MLHPRPLGLFRRPGWTHLGHAHDSDDVSAPGALLEPAEFERVVRTAVDWEQLHTNVRSGVVDALIIAALQVMHGTTTLFSELSRELKCAYPVSDRRVVSRVEIDLQHVLASSAIPGVFPARRLGRHYYCDGGLRFNTPMSPAIRAGAERLLVITMLGGKAQHEGIAPEDGADCPPPRPLFLVGKVLDAVLRDPIEHDLRVLERLNRLAEAMDESLSTEDRQRLDAVVAGSRGAPYRKLPALVFKPSQDLAAIAAESVKAFDMSKLSALQRTLLHGAVPKGDEDAELASYLWFDGDYARRVIDLGRADALARADEIEAFFRGERGRSSVHP